MLEPWRLCSEEQRHLRRERGRQMIACYRRKRCASWSPRKKEDVVRARVLLERKWVKPDGLQRLSHSETGHSRVESARLELIKGSSRQFLRHSATEGIEATCRRGANFQSSRIGRVKNIAART